MKALGDILKGRNLKKTVRIDDKTVFFIFKKVIQDEFGMVGLEKFFPDYYAKETLFIRAENSVWANELWLNREKIIKKMNQEFGEDIILKLKFK